MERCLQIPELVEAIISQLEPSSHASTLAALAQAARLFHDPALNILWRSQPSLVNVLRCLPCDLLLEDRTEDNKPVFQLVRPMVQSDWERPRSYASRVKELRSVNYNLDWPHQDTLSYSNIYPILLSLDLVDGLVLPNLTRLRWVHHDEGFPHLRLFLGPKMTAIHINCWLKKSPAEVSVLDLLPQKCPELKDVFVDMGVPEEPTTNIFSNLIMGLSNRIQSLTVGIPDMSSFMHIARLPALRQLGVRALPASLSTLVPDGSLFLSLRHLNIWYWSLDSMNNFVKLCSGATLESFAVDIPSSSPPQLVESLLGMLADHHRSSLTKLRIGNTEWQPNDHVASADDLFTINTFQPILRLGNLSELRIMSKYGYDFDDSAISQMAKAWPHLRVLELDQEEEHLTIARTTLGALQILARHCPHLTELTIEFSADVLPSVEEPPVPSHPLSYLNVTNSEIHLHPLPVARFISAIFPNLKQLTTDSESVREEFVDRWKEVEMAIPILVQVRQEGMRWAHSGS